MPIQFRCPHCDKLLALGTRQGGTQIHCPMCDHVITVPPRTQVQLPTTTVVLPDAAESWWMDAPPILPPNAEPPAQTPSSAPPPADAWWLVPHTPPAAPEKPLTAAPPLLPPPRTETSVASSFSEPSPNPFVFESPPQAPAVEANETLAPGEQPSSESSPAPRSFPRRYILLLVGLGVAAVVLVATLFIWSYRPDSPTQQSIEEPAHKPAAEDDKTAIPPDAEPQQTEPSRKSSSPRPFEVKYRRQTTEAELRRQVARFPEIALDRGDDRTEAQRVRLLAAESARDGAQLDFGAQILQARPDLAGLPLRKSGASQLAAPAANRLHRAALALRSRLFEAAGGGTQADANKLRTLLDADDAPRAKWLQPEAIPALQQLLMGEPASLREVLVERLSRIDGPQASIALARSVLFDLHPDVRRRALEALAKRERSHYQKLLLDGFAYPWPAVADHAAEALVALDMRETVPELIRLLDRPNPASSYKRAGEKELFVREVVRVNHLHNCLLCHAPSLKESDKLRGFIPPTDRPPPPPYTREYYGSRQLGQFIRADVTYFQQDFSVPLPVANPGKWPAVQRYDFLVREHPAPGSSTGTLNEHPQVLFFALRHLTGADPGPTVEDWKRWAKHSER